MLTQFDQLNGHWGGVLGGARGYRYNSASTPVYRTPSIRLRLYRREEFSSQCTDLRRAAPKSQAVFDRGEQLRMSYQLGTSQAPVSEHGAP